MTNSADRPVRPSHRQPASAGPAATVTSDTPSIWATVDTVRTSQAPVGFADEQAAPTPPSTKATTALRRRSRTPSILTKTTVPKVTSHQRSRIACPSARACPPSARAASWHPPPGRRKWAGDLRPAFHRVGWRPAEGLHDVGAEQPRDVGRQQRHEERLGEQGSRKCDGDCDSQDQ